ncbi:MAG TPA: ferredoxin [Firmicutes bacterium]|jgi:2-oxoglutarate ferredoxin oxidoreductase subunit delta|nr:ferredoxin [Bacillota bacterium]
MADSNEKELKINPSWCKGCGICVAFCPKDTLEMVDGVVRLKEPSDCIMCGICEQRCPDYAIYVYDGKGKTTSE